MKILVEYNVNYDDFNLLGVKNLKEYYDKYHNENGILFDEESESIYYEVDVPFIPIEGQRVGTKFGICIVIYSYLELGTVSESYFDKSRIVITEE